MRTVALLLVVWAAACMRPEKPWQLPQGTAGRFLEAATGSEYDTIVAIRLETGEAYSYLRSAWDLAFAPNSVQGTYTIRTNAAMYAFAVRLTAQEWEALTDPSALTGWRPDLADTAALPPLQPGEEVYFALDRDRGRIFYRTSTERYRKVRVRWEGNTLLVEARPFTEGASVQWRFATTAEPQYLSLQSASSLPWKLPWPPDLLITCYVHPFYDQPEEFRWYPVLGALLGPDAQAAVVQTQTLPYERFTYNDLTGLTFSAQKDLLGYDWKRYDFATGTYTIDFSRYFILQTGPTSYYKLRFVDFYDAAGRKGHVRLEYEPL